MTRRKRPPEPLPRRVEDPVAREVIAKLRAGLVLPPATVADLIESFVLELEERDRLLARIRGRVDVIAARFPEGSEQIPTRTRAFGTARAAFVSPGPRANLTNRGLTDVASRP
jgi:hypothetical protein